MKDAQYQQFASAMSSLQTASNQALRQDLYLEVVFKPNLPDVAVDPKRLHDIFFPY